MARLFPPRVLLARGSGRRPVVALTFDDGPHPVHTPRILDVLRNYGAGATFFAVGKEAAAHPEIVRRMAAEGHTLGCHTHTHCDLSRLSLREARQECRQARETLETISGQPVRYLRPPWGRMALSTPSVALANRMRLILWSLDSLDYQGWSPTQLVDHLHDVVPEPGEILLFHDDSVNTAAALPQILDYLCNSGFSCVTLDALLAS